LDDEIGWNHVIPGNHSGGASKDDIDYPVALAQEKLPQMLKELLDAKNYPDYWSDKKTVEKEILLGMTNRPESFEAMKGIAADEYLLYVRNDKIVLGAWNDEALEFAKGLYAAGVDALIVADLGLVALIRKNLPDFELHASTQMSVNNSVGADFAYDLGCTRVVLARELSGKNIRDVTEKCKAETEVFLHGALCVCHSGQCLFSSMIGGRSGNRGECAQPCRLPYNNGKYVLSLSDLSLADHIDELIDSGVASLKIEGRMKSPDYVYTVTSIYRLLLDERRCSTGEENKRLERIFSRGGFTDGYFTGNTFSSMTGVRTDEDKRISMNEEKRNFSFERTRVKAKVVLELGKPSEMALYGIDIDREIRVMGEAPEPAKNAPLTSRGVKERLAKMGNTFLSLSPDDIELSLDDGVNL
jgi:putative protease